MKAVIQRVSQASVEIGGEVKSSINHGYLILLGVSENDEIEDVDWLVRKVATLRIFSDSDDRMNLALDDVSGDVLVISQFTLHAKTKKGTRPSFIHAAKPDKAIPLYEAFMNRLNNEIKGEVQSGEFGADMKVSLVNDGPVTIIIDTHNKE